MTVKLLLLSNSTNFGGGYLDHAIEEIAAHFSDVRRVAFIPFALKDHQGYGARAAGRLKQIGIEATTVFEGPEAARAIEDAEGVFTGGGNTFRLLDRLYRNSLLEPLRRRVREGMPYLGASAGTGIAAPTIKTTNDMPIVMPPSLDALGVIPFQINPHYIDADPSSTHMGETRETRLLEYLEENETPVVGLREGCWFRAEGGRIVLRGPRPARIFARGRDPMECAPGTDLAALVGR